jgi:hypothetical protein
VGHRASCGISASCERAGDAGEMKEMLLTVLLSNSRKGLTVGGENRNLSARQELR